MHDSDESPAGGGEMVERELFRCVECTRAWLDPAERWRTYILEVDPPEAVHYCPACAMREFG